MTDLPEGTPEDGREDQGTAEGAIEAAAQQPSPEQMEVFALVAGRTMEALAQDPDGLDAALKASPIKGATTYGVRALWSVVDAAEQAGKNIPFEIVVGAGIHVVKALATIANEKGYLRDEDIEGFLAQVFQNSLAEYAALDRKAGKINDKDVGLVSQAAGAMPKPQGALAAAAQ